MFDEQEWNDEHVMHSDEITFACNGEDAPSPDDILAYIAWVNEDDEWCS